MNVQADDLLEPRFMKQLTYQPHSYLSHQMYGSNTVHCLRDGSQHLLLVRTYSLLVNLIIQQQTKTFFSLFDSFLLLFL